MFDSDDCQQEVSLTKTVNSSKRWKMEMKIFQGHFSNSLVILSVDLGCTEMIACTKMPFATWGKAEMTCLQGESGRKA